MELIVVNKGYLNYGEVEKMFFDEVLFSIYETKKGTNVLVVGCTYDILDLYNFDMHAMYLNFIKSSSKVCLDITKIFDSSKNDLSDLSTCNWNGGKQIICYEKVTFDNFYTKNEYKSKKTQEKS